MNDYAFTKDQLILEELYTDGSEKIAHPGGKKPQPLTSSWMMRDREPPPDRKTKYVLFIDDLETTETICRADDMSSALELIDRMKKDGRRAMIRPEVMDEEYLREEHDKDRAENRWNSGFGA